MVNIINKLAMLFLSTTLLITVELSASTQEVIKQCQSCHGQNGNSKKKDIPSIAGFSVKYSKKVMKDFRSDKRKGKQVKASPSAKPMTMNQIAKQINPNDLKAAYTYFSKQKFIPIRQPSNPVLAKKGLKVYNKRCMKCHGDVGDKPEDGVAILKGQWLPYLRTQMDQFQQGKRPMHKKMKTQMNKLKPKNIEPLMHFFAQPQV